jgi:ABC-type oligopeptide transport system substrate-binding subunit
MKRRQTLALGASLALPLAWTTAAASASDKAAAASTGQRVLRYAFQIAETGFDPAAINDTYSRTVTCHIFEALYIYDHLARPARSCR